MRFLCGLLAVSRSKNFIEANVIRVLLRTDQGKREVEDMFLLMIFDPGLAPESRHSIWQWADRPQRRLIRLFATSIGHNDGLFDKA